jgi:hypothetical protein
MSSLKNIAPEKSDTVSTFMWQNNIKTAFELVQKEDSL